MKEISISFSPEELIELAKQLYMASTFFIGFPYDNRKMVDEIFNRVCAVGFLEVPETKAFRHGGPTETLFHISREIDEDCQPVIEQYGDYVVEEYLPYLLADRDFNEKYGQLEPMDILRNNVLRTDLEAMQKKYLEDFERYGVIHLRLEETT